MMLMAPVISFALLGLPAGTDVHAAPQPLSASASIAEPSTVGSQAAQTAIVSDDQHVPTSYDYAFFLPLVLGDVRRAANSALGLQLHEISPTQVDRVYDAGASWIRIPLNWSHIEPENTTPENYQWPSDVNEQLAKAGVLNIRVILTLKSNPSWAATYANGPIDLVDIGELVEFMEAAVAHYGPAPYNIKYWEIYNEPDNTSAWHAKKGWGYFGLEPDTYAQMLSALYGPMKAVDPEAQIVFGGIAYDGWESEGGHFAEDFVDRVLRNGAGAYFDVMNFHYYWPFHEKWDSYGRGIIGKATAMRDKLASYNVYKPLICTETSMWSGGGSDPYPGSDEEQSRYIPQVFARSMAVDLGATIWFRLRDYDFPGVWEYGLLRPDLSPKPSFPAYQIMARQLVPTQYIRALDSNETGSDQIEAYEFARQDGSTLTIVVWTNDEQIHALPLDTGEVTVVDKYGSENTIYDRDDGLEDGRLWIDIGPSPVYLSYQP